MKREHIKTGLIVLLLLIVLVLAFVFYRAAKSIRFQDEELQAAREANEALQSEIDHYEENAAKKEITSVLGDEQPASLPPQLGGSLHYKIQVTESGHDRFDAIIIGKRYRLRLLWENLESRWLLYREAVEQTESNTGEFHKITCAFNDSDTLSREIHQLLTKTDV